MTAAVEQGLVVVPNEGAMELFTAKDATGVDPLLAMIRKRIDAFVMPDVTTAKGRKEIASFAYKIAQSKTALAEVGKALADEAKAIPRKIDASRKKIADTLDGWRDEVRAPLDKWEADEEARVAGHAQAIEQLSGWARGAPDAESGKLRDLLQFAEAYEIGPHLEEFEAEYARAKDGAVRTLKAALAAREKYEAEQAELAVLRREAEERAAKDREDTIRREAAEKAERDAIAKVNAERDAAEAAARAERDAAELAARRQREAIEDAARAEREAAERREAELKRQVEEANRAAAETEARLKREAEAKAAQEATDQKRREEDRAHKAAINRAAVSALVDGGMEEDAARAAIILIAKGAVPCVAVHY